MNSVSLYLHIPFCRQRCSYCDFNTYTTVVDLQETYVDALCEEIRQVGRVAERRKSVHTIFFGGGTPSLMPVTALSRILESVRDAFALSETAEITLEANPEMIDAAYLAGLRGAGVNRISFGVQSANADELRLLGREHDFDTVKAVVATARSVGFDNLNLDLIYGLPSQSMADWQRSLDEVLALEPEHLSLYCLTIEPGTPIKRWLDNGRFQPPDSDLAADQYQIAGEILMKQGLEHYEISNWALPGRECQHNLTYWRNQEYLGLGAGAHGFADGLRYDVVKQPRVYIRRMALGEPKRFPLSTAVSNHHTVTPKEAMSDTVITQLRLLKEGLNLDAFETRFGVSLDAAYDGLVTQMIAWGLLWQENGRLLLTENGRFVSNQVFYRFM